MRQIALLAEQRLIAPIDAELATLLARRAAAALGDVEQVRLVGLTGALLSAERARGNSCVDLRALAGSTPWPELAEAELPPLDAWRAVLRESGLCGDGSSPSPLVLDGDRLYLYRFHAAERRLATEVRDRLRAAPGEPPAPAAETVALFRRLFASGDAASTDWQAVAAAAALRGRLTVITGGPGTGKTTTVARILALLLEREPGLEVALAAPTGKAAARLAEAIRGAELPIDGALRSALPPEGMTLHRLLGYQPWNDRFAHGPDRPLVEDVIVVDEASMVDLLMMDALFAAARPAARIILLGDPDQLASVDTGYVLGDLVRAAEASAPAQGAAFGAWYERLTGRTMPTAATAASALRDAVVRLERSYRFERHPGIGALADAIRAGDGARALDTLADARHGDVRRRDPVRDVAELMAPIAPLVEEYLDADSPEQALERLAEFRVLCALREGRWGVAGLNEAIERWLRGRGVPTRARWYDRRPVLVTANDPATGLFNGDVGVTFVTEGRPLVYFPSDAGARPVSPARLPAHETAWAMTVHKSQGSEFAHVLLVLPEEDNRVLTRELVYTGVTRARRMVDVVSRPEVLRDAVRRTIRRASGLADQLRD